LPSYIVAGVLLLIPTVVDSAWDDYLRAWLGALALFAFYFVLRVVYPAGMGLGDVKLSGVLGLYLAWLGWGVLAIGGFLGFAFGAFVGVAVIVSRRGGRKSKVPFGPFMVLGAWTAVLWGQTLWDAYTGTLS